MLGAEVFAAELHQRMVEDGFAVLPILSVEETRVARVAAERLAAPTLADPLGSSVNSMATLRVRIDPIDGVEYAEHVPRLDLFGAPVLQDLLTDGRIQRRICQALGVPEGTETVLDSISLMVAPAGYRYRQGYHRDTIAVPDADLHTIPPMLSRATFHNSCQINLALADDPTFMAVPASHNRLNTPAEDAAFLHRPLNAAAPIEQKMPGARQILVPSGCMMVCNNNLIHRGWSPAAGLPSVRLTIHGGFHVATHPPTVHFQAISPSDPLNASARARAAERGLASTRAYLKMLEARDARAAACPDTVEHAGSKTQHASKYTEKLAAAAAEHTGPRRVVAVLGGTGRVGSYLCPRLTEIPGVDVVSVSRGQHQPYPTTTASPTQPDVRWARVRQVHLDRAADRATFDSKVAGLGARVVVDLSCFEPTMCTSLNAALQAAAIAVEQYVCTSTVWALGANDGTAPTTEDGAHGSAPLGLHGVQKREITNYVTGELAATAPYSCSVFHLSHIVGRGWATLNPQGNFNPAVFGALRGGTEPVGLPGDGWARVHHGHADDAATAILAALRAPEKVAGEAFCCAAPEAMTLPAFAKGMAAADWEDGDGDSGGGGGRQEGRRPVLEFHPCPSDAFTAAAGSTGAAAISLDHVRHSTNVSVAKLERVLGVVPRWTVVEGVVDGLRWLVEAAMLGIGAIHVPDIAADEREATRHARPS